MWNESIARPQSFATNEMQIKFGTRAGLKLTFLLCGRPKPVHDLQNW